MNNNKQNSSAKDRAKEIIRSQGGMIKTSQALEAGIHPRTLSALCESGDMEKLSRGVYRLRELPTPSNIDFITVAMRSPKAVICLISALSYHNITTQIPHDVSIALKKGSEYPRIEYPPVRVHHFSDPSFSAGVEVHKIDGVSVKIYNPEKTIADCFKFRSELGMEIVIEALRFYMTRHKFDVNKLIKYARVCRVYNVIYPYLESMV